jgi:hypothetical protein
VILLMLWFWGYVVPVLLIVVGVLWLMVGRWVMGVVLG